MNASECCRTIGCNCGGTAMSEQLAMLTWTDIIIAVVATAIVLVVLKYVIEKYSYKNESRKRAS